MNVFIMQNSIVRPLGRDMQNVLIGFVGEHEARTFFVRTRDDLTGYTVGLVIGDVDCGAMTKAPMPDGSTMLSLTLTSDMLGNGGDKVCQLLMVKNTIVRKSSQFRAYVGASNDINSTAPDSATIIIISEKITELVHEATLDAIEEVQEVIDSIPADYSALSSDVTQLKADLDVQVNMLSEYEAVTEVTENLDISNSGLTLQATEDGRVKIFGTATAIRNYGFLNGQSFIATSTSALTKTLDAGTYVIEHGITGSQAEYIIRGTYSTFANYFNIASAGTSQKTVITFEQDVTIAFASPTDRDYGTEENASYLTFKASKVTSKDEKARADLSAVVETVEDIEQALSDTQTEIEQIKDSKSGVYDFELVETSGFGISSSRKWTSSSVAKSHVVKIPKGTRSIAITANSGQTAIIAFLENYAPVVNAQAEFSDGYSERIVINAGESAEYKIENGMNYLYVLIADTSSNDHTPSVSLTYSAKLTLPTDHSDNDRSGEISALLNAFGLCVLEKGTYIIGASIKMHDSSRLEGHGSAIILSDAVADGSAIVMDSNCTITGLVISGGLTAAPSTEGTRNGIEWTGDALLTSYIDKCVVSGFSGSGVFLHDTTAKTFRNLLITNCRVTACFVGIDFRRNSEFNRVSNCTIIANRYGIRNRGGNNHIGNCGLDANYCGILIDMDEGDNTGHGGIANCTINHSNHNAGYGLIIKDTGRMLITACNFYFSKIKLENTNGNIINGCGFGNSTGWEISGGECSLFINCMVASAAQTPVTITDNTAIKIVNCYTRDGAVFTA